MSSAALCAAGLSACKEPEEAKKTTLTVFAASSLTDVFRALEPRFELEHPSVDVRFSFGGSHILRTQIEAGAGADVFASADERQLMRLQRDGRVSWYKSFAQNELVLIVPPANPAEVEQIADLARVQRLVIGSPRVPIGAYTVELLQNLESSQSPGFLARVLANVVSKEGNARLVRTKVELGEADAAVVYRTDVLGSERVRVIEVPDGISPKPRYFVAPIHSGDRELGSLWSSYLRGAPGRRELRAHGFQTGDGV